MVFTLGAGVVAIPGVAQLNLPGSEELCRGDNCPGGVNDSNTDNLGSESGIVNAVISIANFITFVAVGIAVLFIVIGGIYYITANGNEEQTGKGKSILVNAVIGLVIAIIAYTIVFVVVQILEGDFFGGFLDG